MSIGIAIFVKTPALSPLKTRLAAEIGAVNAVRVHVACALACAGTLRGQGPGLQAYWAVAEDAALGGRYWRSLPQLAQGEGDLGARMARVHDALLDRHEIALLIGADAPQVSRSWLLGLQRQPGQGRQAWLGPARDGGFWLVGSGGALTGGPWSEVSYGQSHTRDAFVAAFAGQAQFALLPALTDLDRATDLPSVRAELEALADPSRSQSRLLRTLGKIANHD